MSLHDLPVSLFFPPPSRGLRALVKPHSQIAATDAGNMTRRWGLYAIVKALGPFSLFATHLRKSLTHLHGIGRRAAMACKETVT